MMDEWTLQKVSKNPKAALDEINRLSKEIEIRKELSAQINGEAGAYIASLRSLIGELADVSVKLAKKPYPFITSDQIGDINAPYCIYCHKGRRFGHDRSCPVISLDSLMAKVKEVLG